MARIAKEVNVARSADETWALVGDVGGVAAWVPGVTACSVDGDLRVVTTTTGTTFTERILNHDDAAMRYEYTLEQAPFPVASHLGSIHVAAVDVGSSTISYVVDIEPSELASALEPGLQAALDNLQAKLEPAST